MNGETIKFLFTLPSYSASRQLFYYEILNIEFRSNAKCPYKTYFTKEPNLIFDTIPKKADNRNEISLLASWDELLATINYNTTIPTTIITTSHCGPDPPKILVRDETRLMPKRVVKS